MIYWIILFFVFLTWYFHTPKIFKMKIENIEKFLYVILYRGYAEESSGGNSELDIMINSVNIRIPIIKYKYNGNIGLYLFLHFDKINNIQKEKIISFIEKKKIIFYIRNIKIKSLGIDFKINIPELKILIEFIAKNIFGKENPFITVGFLDICKNPNKLIDFDDAMELEEKGIDIKIPVTSGQWLLWKLRNWGKKI